MITQKFTAWSGSEFIVDVVPGQSITLFRTGCGSHPVQFRIGDQCEESSFNLIYVGTITSITAKNVIIQRPYSDRRRRMKISEFTWRNWNFDAEQVARKNAEVSLYI